MLNPLGDMTERSPATDNVDPHLVDGLIANMRGRHFGDLDSMSLQRDLQRLYDEIEFARQRERFLTDERDRSAPYALGHGGPGTFAALINEHERQAERLDNARKFLKAEKLQLDGFPLDQIALLMEQPGF